MLAWNDEWLDQNDATDQGEPTPLLNGAKDEEVKWNEFNGIASV